MTIDVLKNNLGSLAEKHIQTDEYSNMNFEPNRSEAFRLIFHFSIINNYRVEGYNLKKLVENPQVHWKEICDMVYDINDTPGLADKGFRDLIQFWFNDLCPEAEPSE